MRPGTLVLAPIHRAHPTPPCIYMLRVPDLGCGYARHSNLSPSVLVAPPDPQDRSLCRSSANTVFYESPQLLSSLQVMTPKDLITIAKTVSQNLPSTQLA